MVIASPFPVAIEELTEQNLSAVLQMDKDCFGGLWTEAGYRREIDSPNSQLLIMKSASGTTEHLPEYVPKNAPGNMPTGSSPQPFLEPKIIGIGCVWFILEEAHITVLAIQAPYRRQGLGQLLLTTLLETAIQRQSEWATLEVRLSNLPAQKLYEKFGFITIGQRKKYYPDTGEDALILWNKGLQKRSFHHDLEQLKDTTVERLNKKGWIVSPPNPDKAPLTNH